MSIPIRSANRKTIRRINEALVLGVIHDHGPISRTDIADISKLSPATITGIMGKFIRQGLAREREAGISTGGRPPMLVEIDRDAGCVVGVKLTETHLIAALTDLGANVLAQRTVPISANRAPESVVESLVRVISDLRAAAPNRRFYGAGVGLAGAIDRRGGICRFSPYLPWRDVPLRALLETRISRPVVIENDLNALTLAERWFGGGAGLNDFIVITLGRGVGLGMVLGGRLYRGGQGAGGEFGHITMDVNGPICDCGKAGCLEALIGEPALARQIAAALGPGVSLAEGEALARTGDSAANAIFTSAGQTLGLALAGIVSVLNPTRVIVGGEGVHRIDLLLEPMREALSRHCFDGLADDLDLVVEPWGDDAWARGAAGLMLDELFHARINLDLVPDLDEAIV